MIADKEEELFRDHTLVHLAACRLAQLRSSTLSPEVEGKAVLCLLDYFGALVSGLSTPWSKALLHYARGMSSKDGDCMIVGLEVDSNAETAAFVNASIAHR